MVTGGARCVQSGAARGTRFALKWGIMKFESMKWVLVVGWLLSVGAVAISMDLSSLRGWSILTAISLLPPALLTRLRNATDPSMSEVIQKALGR